MDELWSGADDEDDDDDDEHERGVLVAARRAAAAMRPFLDRCRGGFLSLLVAAALGAADWMVSIDGLDEDRPLSVRRDCSV